MSTPPVGPSASETGAGGPPRARRTAVFLEVTRSLCASCLRVVDAKILKDGDRIVMRKWCPDHGHESVLLHSDADWYLRAQRFNRPGELPRRFPTETRRGCPYDCGLCPEHEQHTCLALVDLTDRCNLSCPTCFADSGGERHLSLEEVEACLEAFVAQEGVASVVQFSGGEPTLHPQLVESVRLAFAKRIQVVMINTNGVRLAEEPDLARILKENGNDRLEIYLQFDGLSDDVYERLRGRKLLASKMRCIENCLAQRLPLHLVATIQRGVNEDQVGPIVELGVKTPGIRGVSFQPACFSGRHERVDQMDRVTITEVMGLVEKQTRGMFRRADFVPLPCSHPSQVAMTYAYVKRGKVKPIPRFVDLEPYLDQFTNTLYLDPSPLLREALKGLWSLGSSFSSARTLYDFSCVCGIPVKRFLSDRGSRTEYIDEHVFRIVMLQFQDRHNWDMKVARKCCLGFALPDGRVVPFDTYNVLHRPGAEASRP